MLDCISIEALLKYANTLKNKSSLKRRNDYYLLVNATDYLPAIASVSQRLWHINNKICKIPLCKTCNFSSVKWQIGTKKYNVYCDLKCSRNSAEVIERLTQTNLERYGVEYAVQSKKIQEKCRKSMLEKYGVSTPFKNEKIKEQIKQTNLDRYGVEHPLQSETIRKKIKQTNLDRYGVENPWLNNGIREQIKQTNLDRYRVENPFQSKKVQNTIKQTNLIKYGVEHPLQSKQIQEKRKQTNLIKYGVQHVLQIKNIRQKAKQTMLKRYGVEYLHQAHLTKNCLEKLNNIDWLMEQHHNNGKTLTQIGNELGIGNASLGLHFKKHNINVKQHNYSYICIKWLESIMKEQNIFIQHAKNKGEYRIPNTRLRVDGYCEQINTIYEFYGDFHHGNPEIYEPNYYNTLIYKTAGELYQQTIEREKLICSLGYTLISIWENDYCLDKYNHKTTLFQSKTGEHVKWLGLHHRLF
ncbi:MAG: DUF7487 domain-containing protein [Nitrosopumilaceae archaeon]